MERRVVFSGWVCPVMLLLPQLAVTIVFFFWPAGQAIAAIAAAAATRSACRPALSASTISPTLFADPDYLASFAITAFFSVAVALLALAPGLLLAVMADRVVRGAAFYKTVLLMPYAIAPAIAGVLVDVPVQPEHRRRSRRRCARCGVDWNYLLNGDQAMLLVILAAAWKQISYNFLFFLAGLAGDPGLADRGLGDRRRERRAGGSGRSSFRCWRRPAFSCSSSTSSMRSSTRSGSSTT